MNMRPTHMKKLVLVTSVILLAACSQATPTGGTDVTLVAPAPPTTAEYEAALSLWETAGIDSYEFVYIFQCECDPGWAGPWRATVTEGVITDFIHDQGLDAVDNPTQLTIPDLFTKAQNAISDFPGNNTIVYDTDFGFPRSVVADVESLAVDGGEAIAVWEFVPAN